MSKDIENCISVNIGRKMELEMKRWKILIILINYLIFILTGCMNAFAQEYISEKEGVDVIFVMDYSGSMKTNDPRDIAQNMVKAFIDSVHSADIRIGFVAYNDRLLSATSPLPVGSSEERQALKVLIDAAAYSGNTDIGLGLRYAYDLVTQEKGRKKVIVLISDGESDLKGSGTGRLLEDSEQDVEYTAGRCAEEHIPIYTIAFGKYDGSEVTLKELSGRTGAAMYPVEKPETLIEVLYGIFPDNMDYSIQKMTDGVYASGVQNILLKLDEAYLDELDVLMISPQTIGAVDILYGGERLQAVNLNNYAVAKITEIKPDIKALTLQTETARNQELSIYLIGYRNLTPVLSAPAFVAKRTPLKYEVYFKDKNNRVIADEAFYKGFDCELSISGPEGKEAASAALDTEIREGVICGGIMLEHSGEYSIEGRLEDDIGAAVFENVSVQVTNRLPSGALPEGEHHTVLSGDKEYLLDVYFSDPDGDPLTYSVKGGEAGIVKAQISDNVLTVTPVKSGYQTISLLISDGEETFEYSYGIMITPLWKAWQPVFVLLGLAMAGILWKLLHKPKPLLEQLAEEKINNRFCGKLDLYVTGQPEEGEEIPPLSFQMYKVKDSRVTLGDLLRKYPEMSDALGLENIHLIADEDRRMVLYHMSEALVMLGNSIVCRQIQYSVSFGDIIYIASQDGVWELEVHYIAMIQ